MDEPNDPTLLALLERCRGDHHAWINGDGLPYALPDDGTVMGAVGGYGRGGQETLERQITVARQWTSGEGTVEFVNGGLNGDIAWLAMIERASVNIRGQSTTRRWDLRVTEVFRRTGDRWERIHRQADPLVDRHDLLPLVALLENHTTKAHLSSDAGVGGAARCWALSQSSREEDEALQLITVRTSCAQDHSTIRRPGEPWCPTPE